MERYIKSWKGTPHGTGYILFSLLSYHILYQHELKLKKNNKKTTVDMAMDLLMKKKEEMLMW